MNVNLTERGIIYHNMPTIVQLILWFACHIGLVWLHRPHHFHRARSQWNRSNGRCGAASGLVAVGAAARQEDAGWPGLDALEPFVHLCSKHIMKSLTSAQQMACNCLASPSHPCFRIWMQPTWPHSRKHQNQWLKIVGSFLFWGREGDPA